MHESFPFPVKIRYRRIFNSPICCNQYANNKRICLYVCYWEKTIPRRTTKFHMKTVRHLNACTYLDFFLLIFMLFVRNNLYYKSKMKFCVFVCKSVCVHAHAQTKKPTTSKFGTEILEMVFEKTSKQFFFNQFRFFTMI